MTRFPSMQNARIMLKLAVPETENCKIVLKLSLPVIQTVKILLKLSLPAMQNVKIMLKLSLPVIQNVKIMLELSVIENVRIAHSCLFMLTVKEHAKISYCNIKCQDCADTDYSCNRNVKIMVKLFVIEHS